MVGAGVRSSRATVSIDLCCGARRCCRPLFRLQGSCPATLYAARGARTTCIDAPAHRLHGYGRSGRRLGPRPKPRSRGGSSRVGRRGPSLPHCRAGNGLLPGHPKYAPPTAEPARSGRAAKSGRRTLRPDAHEVVHKAASLTPRPGPRAPQACAAELWLPLALGQSKHGAVRISGARLWMPCPRERGDEKRASPPRGAVDDYRVHRKSPEALLAMLPGVL